ncbi:MAG TPA: serine hydrolase domain-containing protein [Actinomycetota bacterium]|nr:serine hydrolase domain-containing protein [Actinomycetota bacterium]
MLTTVGPHLASALARFVHDEGLPGAAAAAVVRGSQPWSFAYGVADAGSRSPLDAETAFRVGSLTKPFTAAGVLALAGDGALDVDDPVVAHLPEFRAVRPGNGADPSDVRLIDLLTHRGGLPAEASVLDDAAERYPSIETILGSLDAVTLATPAGAAVRYSNLGYQLLGEIVSRRAGVSYERWCERRLFGPLRLAWTAFDPLSAFASGHQLRAFTDHVELAPARRKRTNADGGLWSTALDQAAWIEAQLEGSIDGLDLRAMHGPTPGSSASGGPGQGVGWFRELRDARSLVYHQGSTPGYAARIAFSPRLRGGAVILTNGETRTAAVLGEMLDLVLDGIEGALPSEPAPAVPPPPTPVAYPAAWDELLGYYVWPRSSMLFRLEVRRGQLRMADSVDAPHPITLDPRADDRFLALDGGWAGETVVVRRDDLGVVRGLRLGPWTLNRLVERD